MGVLKSNGRYSMSKFNGFEGGLGETISRLLDQAKELSAKPVDNLSEAVSNKSLSHIDAHYAVSRHEDLETMIKLLKEQEAYISTLTTSIGANDEKMASMQAQLKAQEAILEGQMNRLKEDNKQCALELKEIINHKDQVEVDYDALEEAFKNTGDNLITQQRAHTVEMDRMMMGVKTSIEKEIEKSSHSTAKHMDLTVGTTQKLSKVTLVMTFVNTLLLVGYIVYDLFL